MGQLKLAVIGAGSTYSPEIMEGLIRRRDILPFTHIALMDIDKNKLQIVGGLMERMARAGGLTAQVTQTTDLDAALTDADFVLVQIRVGGLAARILDEKIPLKYHLIGQETTGIGGFFKALRTIPVVLDIARRMERLCPHATLINFSNPSGLVAQAVMNQSSISMVGLCNIPIGIARNLQRRFGQEVAFEFIGLNHLNWVTSVKQNGCEKLLELIEGDGIHGQPYDEPHRAVFRAVKGIGCSYLDYYYFRRQSLEHLLAKPTTRGEDCQEIEKQLLTLYTDEALYTKPELLNQRGGALYSEAAVSLMESIYLDKGDIHILNVRNQGALPFMQEDDVVEIQTRVGKGGFAPLPMHHFSNRHIIGMMQTVKAYERHAVQAALNGDREEALQALLVHPLIGDFEAARACFEEMLEAHRPYLPQFFK